MSDFNHIGRREYRLYDRHRNRFVPRVRSLLNDREVVEGDEYFARALCPNLTWREPVASGAIIEPGTDSAARVRSYTIKR